MLPPREKTGAGPEPLGCARPGARSRGRARPIRSALEHVFADFADWHSNASPIVAVLDDVAAYGDLVLDITGVAHLFGGEAKMLAQLVRRLRSLGFTVSGAIADTVGAAWALSHFRPGIIAPAAQSEALADLPVVALRLSEAAGRRAQPDGAPRPSASFMAGRARPCRRGSDCRCCSGSTRPWARSRRRSPRAFRSPSTLPSSASPSRSAISTTC